MYATALLSREGSGGFKGCFVGEAEEKLLSSCSTLPTQLSNPPSPLPVASSVRSVDLILGSEFLSLTRWLDLYFLTNRALHTVFY